MVPLKFPATHARSSPSTIENSGFGNSAICTRAFVLIDLWADISGTCVRYLGKGGKWSSLFNITRTEMWMLTRFSRGRGLYKGVEDTLLYVEGVRELSTTHPTVMTGPEGVTDGR